MSEEHEGLVSGTKKLLRQPGLFARYANGTRLRRYQSGVCEAICRSVIEGRGLTFVVMFPRQSGKNELQAQLETYLLALFNDTAVDIIKVSPTLTPQALNAMRRLEKVLGKNVYLSRGWQKSEALYRSGEARITFLSGSPESNIVGATASLLLEVDEAQDVLPGKFDKDIAPMTASTHATRVFWGTAWTSNSLLGRELRAASAQEARDGQKRVFRLTAEAVSAEVPAYQATVDEATWYIFAVRTAGSTTFTLTCNTSATESTDQRLIGELYWDGSAIKKTSIKCYFEPAWKVPAADYDSGWFAAVGGNTYTKTHGIGSTPRLVVVYFNASSAGTSEWVTLMTVQNSANTQSPIGFDSTSIFITPGTNNTYNSVIFSTRVQSNSGYYRIFAWA